MIRRLKMGKPAAHHLDLVFKRIITAIIPILILTSLLTACGIQTLPFLEPPDLDSIRDPLEGSTQFQFGNNTGNNTNYMRGYEILYKFYQTGLNSDYSTEISQLGSNPTYETLIASGYLRMYGSEPADPLYDSFNEPLIDITATQSQTEFDVIIDFTLLAETLFPKITFLNRTLDASRYVKDEDDLEENFYNFYEDFLTTDYSDFSDSLLDTDNFQVYISLFVLSYGKEGAFTAFYSDAAHLGKIRLNITEFQPES